MCRRLLKEVVHQNVVDTEARLKVLMLSNTVYVCFRLLSELRIF
jgi:hypothetical protein